MAIDKKYLVNLSGKEYPLWAGVLDAAHKAGLTAIRTTLLQAPAEENGMVAIVSAEAVFTVDGTLRTFTGLGDASPRNVGPKIATALIRMAETRAKGRALRDGCNI